MKLLVKNIGRIVGIESTGRLRVCGAEMDRLESFADAWLLVDNDRFAAYGRMDELGEIAADRVVDAEGGMLFPSFCDSHTHLVYAGSREQEFLDKINGLSYEEIARRGGGILNSADLLHETSEDDLYAQAMERVREIATVKVLGFYHRETLNYVFREILLLTFCGALVGLPAGWALHRFIMQNIRISLVSFHIHVTPLSYALAFAATLLLAVAVCLCLIRKIDRISMAESLKSIE